MGRGSEPHQLGISVGANLNEAPSELQQLALNILATFLVVTLLNNNRYTVPVVF